MTKEELEKEAEVFVSEKADKGNFDVEKFGKAYFSESSMKQALVKFAEPREKRIAELEAEVKELEKENAELKSGCGMCYRKDKENLTKAKELLERLLITSCNSDVLNLLPNCSEVLRVRVEAEQFLSEVEK